MTGILAAAALLGGLGLLFGAILALSDRFLAVEEDPRIDAVAGMLPGTNCGACGQPGCRALAEKIVAGAEPPGRCTVSSKPGLEAIADFMGVDTGGGDKRVARLHCGGGLGRARAVARYDGPESCRAAHQLGGGGLACSWWARASSRRRPRPPRRAPTPARPWRRDPPRGVRRRCA